MKYTHKHTHLYIMYTKQLQVIIDDKAVHKQRKKKTKKLVCFLSKTKPLYIEERVKFFKEKQQ